MIMFWFLIGFSIDGQNIVIDVFAGGNWEALALKTRRRFTRKLLELAMWAGFIGVVAYFVIGRICTKIGGRLTSLYFFWCWQACPISTMDTLTAS